MNELTKILTEIRTDMAVVKNDLRHHIRRTDLAEENIKLVRAELKTNINKIQDDFTPIKKHIAMVDGVIKFLGVVSIITGISVSFYKLLG